MIEILFAQSLRACCALRKMRCVLLRNCSILSPDWEHDLIKCWPTPDTVSKDFFLKWKCLLFTKLVSLLNLEK